jgi:hypothetical protein
VFDTMLFHGSCETTFSNLLLQKRQEIYRIQKL